MSDDELSPAAKERVAAFMAPVNKMVDEWRLECEALIAAGVDVDWTPLEEDPS